MVKNASRYWQLAIGGITSALKLEFFSSRMYSMALEREKWDVSSVKTNKTVSIKKVFY